MHSIYIQNGINPKAEREINDYYATEPKAAELLLQAEPDLNYIWECACGEGHLAKVFDKHGKLAKASDLINRGYGTQQDFLNDLTINFNPDYFWHGDIVTNPPYSEALEFCKKALNIVRTGSKVCMFLKLTFLEGKERKEFFKTTPPPLEFGCRVQEYSAQKTAILKHSSRLPLLMLGLFGKKDIKAKQLLSG